MSRREGGKSFYGRGQEAIGRSQEALERARDALSQGLADHMQDEIRQVLGLLLEGLEAYFEGVVRAEGTLEADRVMAVVRVLGEGARCPGSPRSDLMRALGEHLPGRTLNVLKDSFYDDFKAKLLRTCAEELEAALSSPDPECRLAATEGVVAFTRYGGKARARHLMRELAASDPDSTVRAVAQDALDSLDPGSRHSGRGRDQGPPLL